MLAKLENLAENPLSPKGLDIKKLVTTKRSFRLRSGNLRVIYELDEAQKAIRIHEVGFRESMY